MYLIEAFRSGVAPPWLVACLLRYVRHPVGYDVAREILLTHPGLSAEVYAGDAMAIIGGDDAVPELKRIVIEGDHLKTRVAQPGG